MNRITLFFFVTFLILGGCSKNETDVTLKPNLVLEKDIYEYLSTDAVGNITIEGNVEWTANLLAETDWVTITKVDNQIQLSMAENTTISERIAKVKVTSVGSKVGDEIYKIIIVKQHGNTPTLIVDTPSFAVESEAATLSANVSSNMEWTANSNADWCVVEREGNALKISLSANSGFASRTSVIAVKGELPVSDKNITITQKGSVSFEVDKKALTFSRTGETQEIVITTDLPWTFASNSSWLTLVKDGNKLKITATTNNLLERLGSIVLSTTNLNVTISVKQSGFSVGSGDLDRQVLIAFYNSMGAEKSGTAWKIEDPLNASTATTSWPGVTIATINGEVRVTKINLTGKTLKGIIPTEIGFLTELTDLQLTNNFEITGTIPTSMGNLINLKSFTASRSKLTGSIPVEFANLKELSILQIHTNQLSGSLPANVFGALTKLTSCELNNNKFTGAIPADMLSNPNWSKWKICPDNNFTNCP